MIDTSICYVWHDESVLEKTVSWHSFQFAYILWQHFVEKKILMFEDICSYLIGDDRVSILTSLAQMMNQTFQAIQKQLIKESFLCKAIIINRDNWAIMFDKDDGSIISNDCYQHDREAPRSCATLLLNPEIIVIK